VKSIIVTIREGYEEEIAMFQGHLDCLLPNEAVVSVEVVPETITGFEVLVMRKRKELEEVRASEVLARFQ